MYFSCKDLKLRTELSDLKKKMVMAEHGPRIMYQLYTKIKTCALSNCFVIVNFVNMICYNDYNVYLYHVHS